MFASISPANHESFSNSSSTPDFKYPVIFHFNLSNSVSHRDASPPLIWAPLDHTIILHIGRTSRMLFTCLMQVVFSLICQTHVSRCVASGETQSKLLTTSRPYDILLVCGILCYGTKCVNFQNL